jgi:hypothetical protein
VIRLWHIATYSSDETEGAGEEAAVGLKGCIFVISGKCCVMTTSLKMHGGPMPAVAQLSPMLRWVALVVSWQRQSAEVLRGKRLTAHRAGSPA